MRLSCTVFELQSVFRRKWPNLTHPTCIFRPRRGWSRSNFAVHFGVIKLESRGYRVVLFVWSYVLPFWYNTGVWQTDRETHIQRETDRETHIQRETDRHTTTDGIFRACTASRGKNLIFFSKRHVYKQPSTLSVINSQAPVSVSRLHLTACMHRRRYSL